MPRDGWQPEGAEGGWPFGCSAPKEKMGCTDHQSKKPLGIDEGPFGNPPKTRRRDYSLVLIQVLWRMRFDLILLIGLCLLVGTNQLPSSWFQSAGVLRLLGIAVSIFIGFRNTQAISRWWEARKLWGSIVNDSRNWSDNLRSVLTRQQLVSKRGQRLILLQVATAWQLNFELRNFWHRELKQLQDEVLGELKLSPTTTLRELGEVRARAINTLHQDGWIDGWGRQQLMGVADACTNAIGGLERIRNTPLPASYDVFVRLINWVFGFYLLAEIHSIDQSWASVVIAAGIFCCFLMAERIGAYVEGPFDADGSSFSLPLNAICLTISRNLLGQRFEHLLHHHSNDPVRWT